MAKLVDARDLKSLGAHPLCRFESGSGQVINDFKSIGDSQSVSLTLTESAKLHFTNLIKLQPKKAKTEQLNLRIKAIAAGTINANIELSYCPKDKQKSSDLPIDCGSFVVYIEKTSEQALIDAVIDYREEVGLASDNNIGKLHIKAPYLKDLPVNTDLFNRISFFVEKEINPLLARHGGLVKLLTVNEASGELVLQFEGGCKGCSMVSFTLKQSIEKSLMAKFPEVVLIKDATDHKTGKDPFYL